MSHFLQYSDRAWGLIRTTSKSEQYVLSYFTEHTLPCYLPCIRKVISKSRSVRRIMFPCYLFVAWGNQDIPVMKNCYHISHRIQSEINADNDIIKQMEDIYTIEQLSENWDFVLKKTQSNQTSLVKLNYGMLKGMKGYWGNSTNGQSQFNVCLNIVGTHYEIAFDKEFLYQSIDSVSLAI